MKEEELEGKPPAPPAHGRLDALPGSEREQPGPAIGGADPVETGMAKLIRTLFRPSNSEEPSPPAPPQAVLAPSEFAEPPLPSAPAETRSESGPPRPAEARSQAHSEVPPHRDGALSASTNGQTSAVRDRFTTRVARFLVADGLGRERLVEGIVADATALLEVGELLRVSEAVAILARGGQSDPGSLDLAHVLADSGVVTRFAEGIGSERDRGTRDQLLSVARLLPDRFVPAMADALAAASDRAVRRSLMAALGSLGEAGRGAALQLLDDARWFAVRNGVSLLAEIGGPGTVEPISTVRHHPDARVRREVVMALGRLGGSDAGAILCEMLRDGDADVRAAAALGVGALGVEEAVPELRDLVAVEENQDALIQFLRALGRVGHAEDIPLLEKQAEGARFSRPSRPIRVAAYQALATMGTEQALAIVDSGKSDRDPEVRRAVSAILRRAARPDPPTGPAPLSES